MKLAGKVAIITGSGSGIGRASALIFAQEGAKVVVADCIQATAEQTVSLIRQAGGEAISIQVDVSKEASVENMVRFTVEHFGKLDILFNNAGVEGLNVPTHELPEEEWDREIAINLKGVFLGSKHAIRQMLKNGGGVIINTASSAGLIGLPPLSAYCASKGGVVNLTRELAMEYARQGIRVNCICPGVIKTAMIERVFIENPEKEAAYAEGEPIGRLGNPEEIARAALFLACDDSSFVTGTILPVDGGWVAR